MRHYTIWFKTATTLGMSLFVASMVLLLTLPSAPANAQCGADASSCKRCHQGDEAYPVNELGQWHVDHAEEDFCQICHGGDKATDDAAAAHVDMFEPLGDKGSARCAACHAADSDERLATYDDLLASYNAAPAEAAADATATAEVATTSGDTGYDWRNMALAGFAGVLTMLSGIAVWNFEHISDRIHRDDDNDHDNYDHYDDHEEA